MRVFKEVSLSTIFLLLAAVSQPAIVWAEYGSTEHEPFASVLTSDAQRTLLLWLECDHCPPQLLDRVVRLGPEVIPYLRAALVQGVSSMRLLDAARSLRSQYGKLVDYKRTHPNSLSFPTERDYITTHLLHLTVQYQIRAARALGAIGTPVAKDALEEALQSTTSAAVKVAIKHALKTTKSYQQPNTAEDTRDGGAIRTIDETRQKFTNERRP